MVQGAAAGETGRKPNPFNPGWNIAPWPPPPGVYIARLPPPTRLPQTQSTPGKLGLNLGKVVKKSR